FAKIKVAGRDYNRSQRLAVVNKWKKLASNLSKIGVSVWLIFVLRSVYLGELPTMIIAFYLYRTVASMLLGKYWQAWYVRRTIDTSIVAYVVLSLNCPEIFYPTLPPESPLPQYDSGIKQLDSRIRPL